MVQTTILKNFETAVALSSRADWEAHKVPELIANFLVCYLFGAIGSEYEPQVVEHGIDLDSITTFNRVGPHDLPKWFKEKYPGRDAVRVWYSPEEYYKLAMTYDDFIIYLRQFHNFLKKI